MVPDSNTVRYEATLEPLLGKLSDLLRSYAVYSSKGREYVRGHEELLQVAQPLDACMCTHACFAHVTVMIVWIGLVELVYFVRLVCSPKFTDVHAKARTALIRQCT